MRTRSPETDISDSGDNGVTAMIDFVNRNSESNGTAVEMKTTTKISGITRNAIKLTIMI